MVDKVNNLTYDEWFAKVVELIAKFNINKKAEDRGRALRACWEAGDPPPIALRSVFPEYWRF